MKNCLLLMLILVTLTGCGMVNGESDYVPYTEALENHSHSEAIRITNQTNGIITLARNIETKTETEKALVGVLAMISIERLQPTSLNIIKPTTGYDVLNRHLGSIISTGVLGVTSYFAWDTVKDLAAFGGNTFNGSVNATGAFNNSELHQTYSSGATGTLQPYAVQPAVVTQPAPLVVRP